MNSFLNRLFLLSIKFPGRVCFVIFISVIAIASGLFQLQISNDFRVYLSKNNPQLQAFEEFEDNYVKSNSATFVVTAKEGDIFTKQGLLLIESLTQEAWQVSFSYRVSSLTNYLYTAANEDDIDTHFLVENAEALLPEELHKIRQIALQEKRLVKNWLTADGKLGLVVIHLNLPQDNANASLDVTRQMESIRDKYRAKYPQFDIKNGGSTAFNATLARAVAHDISTLLPLSYVIIFLGLLFFFRSFIATTAIFILISSCLLVTFGFFGWISPTLTPIAGFAPSILLSIMVADSVHILVSYQHELYETNDKKQAIINSLKINFSPVLITSITTIIGFLSLNFSASPPYQDLGNMVALGVLIALVFSLLLLPSLMMLLPKPNSNQKRQRYIFSQFSQWVIFRKRGLLIFTTLLTIALVVYIPNNKIRDNWAEYFDDSFEIVRLVNKIDGYLTGINALEYSFASNAEEGIFAPEYLHQLDQFEQWFREQPKVFDVKSLSLLMKDLNQVMHADQAEWYRTPESSELAAQYLLFYEFGLPEGMGLNNLITIHKDASRFTVSVSNSGSDELLALDAKAQNWLKQNAPALKAEPATGLGVVFAHIAQRNIKSLLIGTFVALVGISLVLMLVLKSFKYGLISLVPNIIPAALAYGFWGAFFGYVDISLSIVACSTLGIVVDDTVHFLHKYIYARKQGKSAEESVQSAFARVGGALVTTSCVLAGGFIILAFSNMNTSAAIGVLMAVTLIFALIVDFLLLPPLLLFFDKTNRN